MSILPIIGGIILWVTLFVLLVIIWNELDIIRDELKKQTKILEDILISNKRLR